MKMILAYILLVFVTSLSYGQDALTENHEKNYIEVNPFGESFKGFSNVDQWAKYPGGKQGILQHIEENLKYPEIAKKQKIEGSVTIEYTIETNGSVDDIKVIKSDNPVLEVEAKRVIELMDKWIPSSKNGKPIKTKYKQVINFKL